GQRRHAAVDSADRDGGRRGDPPRRHGGRVRGGDPQSLRNPRGPERRVRAAGEGDRVAVDALVTALLIVLLFVLLGSGLWIGLSLLGVALIGVEAFPHAPLGCADGA